MAFSGQPGRQLAEQQHRVDRVGLDLGLGVHRPPPALHPGLDALAPGPVLLALEVRDQGAQGGGGVADEVDLVRVAHPDELAVDVDLDPAGLAELRQELRVREVRAHRQQGVAVHHQLVARPGAEQADGPGHVGQLVGEHVLAEQRLGHPGAEQLGDLLELAPRAAGTLPGQDRDLASRR